MTTNIGQDVGTQKFYSPVVGMKTNTTIVKTSLKISQKLWNRTAVLYFIPGHILREFTFHHKDICILMFIAALFMVVINLWSINKWLAKKKNSYIYGLLFSWKVKSKICRKMNGLRIYAFKWGHKISEGKVKHVLLYL